MGSESSENTQQIKQPENSTSSRRQFLKTAAVGSGAAAFGFTAMAAKPETTHAESHIPIATPGSSTAELQALSDRIREQKARDFYAKRAQQSSNQQVVSTPTVQPSPTATTEGIEDRGQDGSEEGQGPPWGGIAAGAVAGSVATATLIANRGRIGGLLENTGRRIRGVSVTPVAEAAPEAAVGAAPGAAGVSPAPGAAPAAETPPAPDGGGGIGGWFRRNILKRGEVPTPPAQAASGAKDETVPQEGAEQERLRANREELREFAERSKAGPLIQDDLVKLQALAEEIKTQLTDENNEALKRIEEGFGELGKQLIPDDDPRWQTIENAYNQILLGERIYSQEEIDNILKERPAAEAGAPAGTPGVTTEAPKEPALVKTPEETQHEPTAEELLKDYTQIGIRKKIKPIHEEYQQPETSDQKKDELRKKVMQLIGGGFSPDQVNTFLDSIGQEGAWEDINIQSALFSSAPPELQLSESQEPGSYENLVKAYLLDLKMWGTLKESDQSNTKISNAGNRLVKMCDSLNRQLSGTEEEG